MKKTPEKYLWTVLVVLAVLLLILASGTASVLEVRSGTDWIREKVFNSCWFECLFAGMLVLLLYGLLRFRWYRKGQRLNLFTASALILIICGAGLTHCLGQQGTIHLCTGESASTMVSTHKTHVDEEGGSRSILPLPIRISLDKLNVVRYPGTLSPRHFEAELRVHPDENSTIRQKVSLNNPMKFNGYRIFILSFDSNEKGAVFLVSYDYWGTILTYAGYLALFLSLLSNVLNPAGRFRRLLKQMRSKSVLFLFFALAALPLRAAGSSEAQELHLRKLSGLVVYNAFSGRYEPFYTFATEHVRKISGQNAPHGLNPLILIMQLTAEPAVLNKTPLIKISPKIRFVKSTGNGCTAYSKLFDVSGNYLLAERLNVLYASDRRVLSKEDQELIKLDDRVNLYELLSEDQLIRLYPDHAVDSIHRKTGKALWGAYKKAWIQAERTGHWQLADSALLQLENHQKAWGGSFLPSGKQVAAAVMYTRFNPFNLLRWAYLALALLMFLAFIPPLLSNRGVKGFFPLLSRVAGLLFILFTGGMILRGYVSGHLPFSNGYETVLLVAWTLAGCGLLLRRISHMAAALSVALTAVLLLIASMSWMNPAITNLAPVLSSGWLMLHVSVVTLSYGFLGLASFLGLLNALQIILRGFLNMEKLTSRIQKVAVLTEILLRIGVLFLITGCMLGAVWANNSWGTYWGWDSKESWALISILTYTGMALGRSQKILGDATFSTGVFLSLGTLLTTFLGANYFFVGMHAYAGGNAPAGLVPGLMCAVIFALILVVLTGWAAARYRKTTGK